MRFPLSAVAQWRRPDPVSAGRHSCTGALRSAAARAPCGPPLSCPANLEGSCYAAGPGRRL